MAHTTYSTRLVVFNITVYILVESTARVSFSFSPTLFSNFGSLFQDFFRFLYHMFSFESFYTTSYFTGFHQQCGLSRALYAHGKRWLYVF